MTEWCAVPGFNGYEVSDDGMVRGRRGLMTQHIDACGYYRLGLYSASGQRVNKRVHRLVAEAFLGPHSDDAVTRHIDGNHRNNHVSNLAWGSQSENVRYAVTHGTQRNIRKTHCPRNHEYTDANTSYESKGNRKCRTCRRDTERSRRAQRKADAA